jgi:hypothetical protein
VPYSLPGDRLKLVRCSLGLSDSLWRRGGAASGVPCGIPGGNPIGPSVECAHRAGFARGQPATLALRPYNSDSRRAQGPSDGENSAPWAAAPGTDDATWAVPVEVRSEIITSRSVRTTSAAVPTGICAAEFG